MLDPLPTYPATGAFVVQLHREARPEHGRWIGRIEHVASGRSHEFKSRRSLLDWLLAQASSASMVREGGDRATQQGETDDMSTKDRPLPDDSDRPAP